MKKMLQHLWFKYQTKPALTRRVQRASLALIYVDDIMKRMRRVDPDQARRYRQRTGE